MLLGVAVVGHGDGGRASRNGVGGQRWDGQTETQAKREREGSEDARAAPDLTGDSPHPLNLTYNTSYCYHHHPLPLLHAPLPPPAAHHVFYTLATHNFLLKRRGLSPPLSMDELVTTTTYRYSYFELIIALLLLDCRASTPNHRFMSTPSQCHLPAAEAVRKPIGECALAVARGPLPSASDRSVVD